MDIFLRPNSVAVIGATETPGAWGCLIMESLLYHKFPGKLYPVNLHGHMVCDIPAFRNILDIPGNVDIAVIAIPERVLEETLEDCGKKGVKGVIIITAGFKEAVNGGKERETGMLRIARFYNMRILGPNVSGVFNLQENYNASGSPNDYLLSSPLAAICQGGYAVYDLMSSAFFKGMGVGKFVHTGNECDLTINDFLNYFGRDPEVKGILMYLETIRDGNEFIRIARQVSMNKPVIVLKAGNTSSGSRAAKSHTGALAGRQKLFEGAFKQANVILCPSMELLFPLGHALIERPPMRGNRVAIVTMGGSWGVTLADCLEKEGLTIPILGSKLQSRLKALGMPERASTRNPVDIGAAGLAAFPKDILVELGREILLSGEVDALIFHGFGRPGINRKEVSQSWKDFFAMERAVMKGYHDLETELEIPVILGSCLTHSESQAVHNLNLEGIRVVNRLDEIAFLLACMYQYSSKSIAQKK